MGVKITQFAYDDEWNQRKLATKATWKQVMEAGIIALEGGVTPAVKEKPAIEQPESPPEPKKEEVEETQQYYLQLDRPENTSKREFHVLLKTPDPDKPERILISWNPSPFSEIDMDRTFRIMDDGVLVQLEGFTRFKKLRASEVRNNLNYVLVEPLRTPVPASVS